MEEIKIWVHDNGAWREYTVTDYLKISVDYRWNDIVAMSIEQNISFKRLLTKLIKAGHLKDINSAAMDQLINQIRLFIYNS